MLQEIRGHLGGARFDDVVAEIGQPAGRAHQIMISEAAAS